MSDPSSDPRVLFSADDDRGEIDAAAAKSDSAAKPAEGDEGYYDLEPEPADDEGEGEDLIAEGMEKDYKPDPLLDKYDEEMLDKDHYEPIAADQRAAAEAELQERDRERTAGRRQRGGLGWLARLPAVLAGDDDADADGSGDDEGERRRRSRRQPKRRRLLYADADDAGGAGAGAGEAAGAADEAEAPLDAFALEGVQGRLREWLALDAPRLEVARRFKSFLLSFREGPEGPDAPPEEAQGQGQGQGAGSLPLYRKKITAMCAGNKESLEVSYVHLSRAQPTLSTWLAEEPGEMLPILDETAKQVVLTMFREYGRIATQGIKVRITDLPIVDALRDLRKFHLGHLIRVSGVVTRRTGVFPQLVAVKYDCPRCQRSIGPFAIAAGASFGSSGPAQIAACPGCHARGPFTVNVEQTLYRNYQKLTLQESPGSVPPGRLPRSKDVVVLNDLIDTCKPGEEIEVIGTYRHNYDVALNKSHGFPVFATVIEANNIVKKDDALAGFRLSEEDEQRIRALSNDDRLLERILASIAPSIFGHTDVKTAIALSLFGGETHVLERKGQHRIRGDINVLLLGDPGTAKSQFLKYIEKTSHRAVYTTGKGSTAVGLTASVHKDPVTREWTLEGGALVLADRGVCLIDEFDKMNDKDRTSIHEAMEQQSISISKAGIVTTLQARCSVVAAANPRHGRYDAALSLSQNVELTEPILSRFDVVCVVRDIVNPVADEQLATFVAQSHMANHPDRARAGGPALNGLRITDDTNLIPQELLRKYIVYARKKIHPGWLQTKDYERVSELYVEMRRESAVGGGLAICTRHVESIMRLAEACAKMHLRENVSTDDISLAVRVMLESFVGTHRFSVARSLRRRFAKYLSYRRDDNELLYHILLTMARERSWLAQTAPSIATSQESLEIDRDEFESRAREMNITQYRAFYESALFRSNGFEVSNNRIFKRFG
eukprot:m51a1_g2265 putative dna replication licensing factor mcm2 (949) ;mRNA; f:341298-344987